MRRMPRGGLLLAVTVACTAAAPGALADGSGDQKAAAQVLFDRAEALVEQNRFAEACPQFAESERLDPGLGTMLWLADCYENNGQTASAWAAFEQAAAMAASRHDARESVARDRAARLEARLSHLAIVVPPAVADTSGLEIHCDGVSIESAQWAHALALEPGAHTITANATNRQLWWTTVQLTVGAPLTTITIPELLPLPPPAPAAPVPAANGAVPSPMGSAAPAPDRPGTAQRVAGVALAAGGVLGIVVGSVFSLNAKARYDDSKAFCLPDNECGAIGKQDRSDAHSIAAVATAVMGAGVAVLAGGAVVYFTAPRTPSVAMAFAPDSRGGSLRIEGDW